MVLLAGPVVRVRRCPMALVAVPVVRVGGCATVLIGGKVKVDVLEGDAERMNIK